MNPPWLQALADLLQEFKARDRDGLRCVAVSRVFDEEEIISLPHKIRSVLAYEFRGAACYVNYIFDDPSDAFRFQMSRKEARSDPGELTITQPTDGRSNLPTGQTLTIVSSDPSCINFDLSFRATCTIEIDGSMRDLVDLPEGASRGWGYPSDFLPTPTDVVGNKPELGGFTWAFRSLPLVFRRFAFYGGATDESLKAFFELAEEAGRNIVAATEMSSKNYLVAWLETMRQLSLMGIDASALRAKERIHKYSGTYGAPPKHAVYTDVPGGVYNASVELIRALLYHGEVLLDRLSGPPTLGGVPATKSTAREDRMAETRAARKARKGGDPIPPERRSKPLGLAEAGKYLGIGGSNQSRTRAVRTMIGMGSINAEMLTRQSYVFDVSQFPAPTHPKIKPLPIELSPSRPKSA